MNLYADIVIPLVFDTLTFAVGNFSEQELVLGSRVIVQVQRKFYTGVVWRIHNNRPSFATKPIQSIVDSAPCLPLEQMKLFEWMADYYMTPLGLVLKAALPSLLSGSAGVASEIKTQGYRKKNITHLVLGSKIETSQQLDQMMETLKKTPKQKQALVDYIAQAWTDEIDLEKRAEIPLSAIDASRAIIKQLELKGVFELINVQIEVKEDQVIDDLDALPEPEVLPQLSLEQDDRLGQIETQFESKDTVLFRGVTGSGKTEIYIHLINKALEKNNNVLFMIPEIALTTQLIERLRNYFGNRVLSYHSRCTDNNRALIYSRLLDPSQQGLLVVGVRSSVFLPLQNLSLVIVDEEHDTSYKQSDKSPNYHAKDTALVMAKFQNAKTLLASATPSLESYYNTLSGKYGYVELDTRYQGVPMPSVIVSDSKLSAKRGERRDHINLMLANKIKETLDKGEQVMLFQNRRGFAPYVECGSCSHVPYCPDCSVSLTYHQSDNSLRCHYCGYAETLDQSCSECGHGVMVAQGFGTEKIEQVLSEMFPEARIARLDSDSVRAMGQLSRTLNSFRNRSIDILIGTQMITKGFDFGGVTLVGVLNADNMLHYPDFRAGERAFAMMIQVAGRSGRRDSQGQVIIQSSNPENSVIKAVCRGEYNVEAQSLLREREMFLYPPYSRMIKITLSASNRDVLWAAAGKLASRLREIFGRRTLGPEVPSLERLRGKYNAVITVKIERRLSFARARELIREAVNENSSSFKNVAVYFDVDPI